MDPIMQLPWHLPKNDLRFYLFADATKRFKQLLTVDIDKARKQRGDWIIALFFLLIISGVTTLIVTHPTVRIVSGILVFLLVGALGHLILVRGSFLRRAERLQCALQSGELRDVAITPDDYSFEALMDEDDQPRYRYGLFLFLPQIIKADRTLRGTGGGDQNIRRRYQARYLIVETARQSFSGDSVEHLNKLAANAVEIMNREIVIQAKGDHLLEFDRIQADYQRKVQIAQDERGVALLEWGKRGKRLSKQ
jgi:hypothetical protein